jgi:hypothetical protein
MGVRKQQENMRNTKPRSLSAVSAAFVANSDFLKRFLARFFFGAEMVFE